MGAEKLKARLLARVKKTETCWNWTGARMPRSKHGRGGYGAIGVGTRVVTTHRLAFELFFGPIPKGTMVLHRCDNRICVNPEHLYLGSAKRNTRDMLDRAREAWGERNGQAKLTEDDIRRIFALRRQRLTQRRIASQFGVTQSAISRILSRECWRRLEITQ